MFLISKNYYYNESISIDVCVFMIKISLQCSRKLFRDSVIRRGDCQKRPKEKVLFPQSAMNTTQNKSLDSWNSRDSRKSLKRMKSLVVA